MVMRALLEIALKKQLPYSHHNEASVPVTTETKIKIQRLIQPIGPFFHSY